MSNMLYEGVVESNSDPLGAGRVKVRIPYLDNNTPLDQLVWCRISTPFGGVSDGTSYGQFTPIMNKSKVTVAFLNNDPSNRVILGCIWSPGATTGLLTRENKRTTNEEDNNTNDKAEPHPASKPDSDVSSYSESNGSISPAKYAISSFKGHYLLMDDNEDKLKLKSASGHVISLDDISGNISILNASGTASITLTNDGSISIFSSNDIAIASNSFNFLCAGSFRVKASDIHLSSGSNLNIGCETLNISSCNDATISSCANLYLSASGGQVSVYGSSSMVINSVTFSNMKTNSQININEVMPPIQNGDTSIKSFNLSISDMECKIDGVSEKPADPPEDPSNIPKY